MKILMTGASSFTGFWFAQQLAQQGHDLVLTFRQAVEQYDPLRRRRVEQLLPLCRPLWGCSFGDPEFLAAVESESHWDVYCHHGAEVTDYKSRDFDLQGALARNTRGLVPVLEAFRARGLRRVVATGSVFEADEGAGEEPRRAFSPYGLSKSLTWQVWRHWCEDLRLPLGKFVIPNPFGPLEEPRFTAYLIRTWLAGQKASVKTPLYVRDNIHVSALAYHYAQFVSSADRRLGPSGYVESQGAFTLRFQAAMRSRLQLPCEVEFDQQTEFTEPMIRINTDLRMLDSSVWHEDLAWDSVAEFYLRRHAQRA